MSAKKTTFGKSFENLTKNQFDFLSKIRGGAENLPGDDIVLIPTRIIKDQCPDGYIWDPILERCVRHIMNNPGDIKTHQ